MLSHIFHKMMSCFCRTSFLIGILAVAKPAILKADFLADPAPEGTFGGKILWMDAIYSGDAKGRIFVSTNSTNSMFYSDIDHNQLGTDKIGLFQGVPDLVSSLNSETTGGFGGSIFQFSADPLSGQFYFTNSKDYKLYRCGITEGSLYAISTEEQRVNAVLCKDKVLLYLAQYNNHLYLYYGTITADGSFGLKGGSVIRDYSGNETFSGQLLINPVTTMVYICLRGEAPAIYVSSDAFSSLSDTTAFNQLPVTDLGTRNCVTFDIGPDGRFFAGGNGSSSPFVAYTDNSGTSWQVVETGVTGSAPARMAFSSVNADGSYSVFFGNQVNAARGAEGSWSRMPVNPESYVYPDSGAAVQDPHDPSMVYLSTRAGTGVTFDKGTTVYGTSTGIMALSVRNLQFADSGNAAWLATDSGVRYGRGLLAESHLWGDYFPDRNRSDYPSVSLYRDSTGIETLYVGADKLFRSVDNAATWNSIFKLSDYGSFVSDSYVSAIGLSQLDGKTGIIGINAETPVAGNGKLFYSNNIQSVTPTWTQIETGTIATEVNDILWVNDGSSTNEYTIYVACAYVQGADRSSYGVKTLKYNPHTGVIEIASDMAGDGGLITNFNAIHLAIDSAGNVYAAGGEISATTGISSPAVYVFEKGSSYWIRKTNDGIDDFTTSCAATAITIGRNDDDTETPFIGVNENIYYFGGEQWIRAYNYPDGTSVRALGWMRGSESASQRKVDSTDTLYVGTDHGLFTQKAGSTDSIVILKMVPNPEKGGISDPAGVLAVTRNTDIAIKAIPADGYQFVGWEATEGYAQITDIAAAETTVKLLSDAVLTARFSYDKKGTGSLQLDKLTIQLSQDGDKTGIKEVFRDSIKLEMTLPEDFPYSSLTESMTMWIDSFGTVYEQALTQQNPKRPVYTLSSNTASIVRLTINNVSNKGNLKLTVTKAAAFSTINPSDGISVYIRCGGYYYFGNFLVDNKTTWTFKSLSGDPVMKFSGTYYLVNGASTGKDKFQINGENIVKPNTNGFDFNLVTTTLKLNQASWTSVLGAMWKHNTWTSAKNVLPKVQMKLNFDNGTWSTKVTNCSDGALVATDMGNVLVNLICRRDDGTEWTLISRQLKKDNKLKQKTKLTMPKSK